MKYYVVLFLLAILLMTGCSHNVNNTGDNSRMTIGNKNIELGFDQVSGNLMSFYSKKSKTDFLVGEAGGGYALMIDLSQGNIWNTDPDQVTIFSSEDIAAKNVILKDKRTLEITKAFPIGEGRADIIVVQTVTVVKDGSDAEITYKIDNFDSNCTVLAIEARPLVGLQGEYDLLWPYKEGEIREDIVAKYTAGYYPEMTASYPVPFSMQYVELFNDTESLYFGVHDPAADFKSYKMGQQKGANGYYAMLATTLWPFISGGSYQSPSVVIGAYEGDWHKAADRYSEFIDVAGWTREKNDMVKELNGWYPQIINHFPDKRNSSYVLEQGMAAPNGLSQLAKETDGLGVDMLHVLGWHLNGFDSRYPDYEFDPEMGGEDGYRRSVEAIHNQGDRIMMYMNNHIAETQSKWYGSDDDGDGVGNGEQSGLRNAKGELFFENYGTGLSYVAMCPAAPSWRKALSSTVERLRSHGTDAIWFDQMMEMPAVLCFDKTHGHRTPATAFSEGYKLMMEEIETIMSEDGDYLLAVEGVCDAYLQYIDVAGMMWARLIGFSETSKPEITRYTLPIKILGLPNHGMDAGVPGAFGRAFVMGEPFLVTIEKNPELAILTEQYQRYPQIYGGGIYKDKLGLQLDNSEMYAGVILSESGQGAAIHMYNPTDHDITVKGSIDGKKFGLDIKHLVPWRHTEVKIDGASFEVTLKPNGIVAIVAEID